MTRVNPNFEFILLENTVYKIKPTAITNINPIIHIKGTGSVDINTSTLEPVDANDFSLNTEDTDLLGFYNLNSVPNFIRITPNGAGTRSIVIKGITAPEVITF